MYILKFQDIYKTPIWGGRKIGKFKSKPIGDESVGESWEISAVEGDVSVVANGPDAGSTLTELIAREGAQLLGHRVMAQYGNRFPLLIKFIDACDNLSIQVHTNDDLARERHNSFGKSEMWFVRAAEEGAGIYSGFSRPITPEEYCRRVADNTIMDVVQFHPVKGGEVFYLPSGRIHAIGRGVFVAEIQQTSNLTYRIYDYDRCDKDGNKRELHTELAREAIDYTMYDNLQTFYTPCINKAVQLVDSPYFATSLLHIDAPCHRAIAANDSFMIYMCMQGSVVIETPNGELETLRQGETALVPAAIESLLITPSPEAKLLECFVPNRNL